MLLLSPFPLAPRDIEVLVELASVRFPKAMRRSMRMDILFCKLLLLLQKLAPERKNTCPDNIIFAAETGSPPVRVNFLDDRLKRKEERQMLNIVFPALSIADTALFYENTLGSQQRTPFFIVRSESALRFESST